MSAYLQLVCLAEGYRTAPDDISALVRTYNGDVRRCLLVVQLWFRSGGSLNPIPDPIRYAKRALSSKQANVIDEGIGSQSVEENSQNPAGTAVPKNLNSEDDFESPIKPFGRRRSKKSLFEDDPDSPIKTTRRKRTIIKDEDESSQENTTVVASSVVNDDSQQDSQPSAAEEAPCHEEETMETVALVDGQPAIHKGMLMATVTGDSHHQDLLEV